MHLHEANVDLKMNMNKSSDSTNWLLDATQKFDLKAHFDEQDQRLDLNTDDF